MPRSEVSKAQQARYRKHWKRRKRAITPQVRWIPPTPEAAEEVRRKDRERKRAARAQLPVTQE